MQTPQDFYDWLLSQIDQLTEWSKPMTLKELPEDVEVMEVDEEWPGPDLDVLEDAADVVREAGELALRFGLPDLYRECQIETPMLAITTAKEMLGRCLRGCRTLPSDMIVSIPPCEQDYQEKRKRKLGLIYERAYSQYLAAKKAIGKDISDERAYRWAKGHQNEDDPPLPPRQTWSRYVREARRHHGTQKRQPREETWLEDSES